MPDQVADRERFDKERKQHQEQGDAEFEKVKVTIEKVKVDVPQNVRPKLDEVLQSVPEPDRTLQEPADAAASRSEQPAGVESDGTGRAAATKVGLTLALESSATNALISADLIEPNKCGDLRHASRSEKREACFVLQIAPKLAKSGHQDFAVSR